MITHFTQAQSIAKINIKRTPMAMEGSWGSHSVGAHRSTMELFFNPGQAGSGFIEWDIPGLETTEHIYLTWDNHKNLLDYSGVCSLPKEAIALLEQQGFTVSEEFRV